MIKVEDIEAAREFGPPTWYAYLVVHPVTKVPLYAGITASITGRSAQHIAPSSPVRAILGDLIPEIVVVGRYETKDEAIDHEIRLINETPNLLNQISSRATGRPRLGEEHKTIEANRPWEEQGISRRTWYARRRKEKKVHEQSE
jgi:predicted GIY-YIG superfamily endonuclease